MIKRRFKGTLLLFLVLAATPLFSANVDVPILELDTWGKTQGGSFGFVSRGELELRLEGGYKFGGRVLFRFFSTTLETASFDTPLAFKAAGIQLRDVFSLPLDLRFFIGEDARFGYGDVFSQDFATPPLASRYQSFLHFPDSESFFRGIYTINGTGITVDFELKKDTALLSLFLYQDSRIDEDGDETTLDRGHYSADLRAAFSFKKLKLEAFLGATYPTPDSAYGYYRGGLLFHAADQGVEFLAELGVPRWSPITDSFGLDLFYLLVEPRVRMGLLSIVPTFFWRPAYYNQQATGEQAIDINLDLQIGRSAQGPVAGGLESNFVYQTETAGVMANEFRVKVSPYLQFITHGVLWELRVTTNVWPYNLSELFEVFLAVKAEF